MLNRPDKCIIETNVARNNMEINSFFILYLKIDSEGKLGINFICDPNFFLLCFQKGGKSVEGGQYISAAAESDKRGSNIFPSLGDILPISKSMPNTCIL